MFENCPFGLRKPKMSEDIPYERLEQFGIPLNNKIELLLTKGRMTETNISRTSCPSEGFRPLLCKLTHLPIVQFSVLDGGGGGRESEKVHIPWILARVRARVPPGKYFQQLSFVNRKMSECYCLLLTYPAIFYLRYYNQSAIFEQLFQIELCLQNISCLIVDKPLLGVSET